MYVQTSEHMVHGPFHSQDDFSGILHTIQMHAEPHLTTLKEKNLIPIGHMFDSLTPDVTRFMLKQHEKTMLDSKDGDKFSDTYRAVVALHALVSAADNLVHCCLPSTIAILTAMEEKHTDILGDLLTSLRRQLFESQCQLQHRKVLHPKVTVMCSNIANWYKRKKQFSFDQDPKILVILRRDLPSLRECVGEALSEMEDFQPFSIGKPPSYQEVVESLDHHNCIIVSSNQIGRDFFLAQFSLVVEYEQTDDSSVKELCQRQNIRHLSLRATKGETPRDAAVQKTRSLNSTHQFTFIGSENVTSNADLLQYLESKYQVTIIERIYRRVISRFKLHHADLVVDERTCVVLENAGNLVEADQIEPLVEKIIALSLKFEKCWIIINSAQATEKDKAKYIFAGNVCDNLYKLYGTLAQACFDPKEFSAQVIIVNGMSEVAELIRKIGEATLEATSVWSKKEWIDRSWLTEEMSEHEKFLLVLPWFNPLSAQILLTVDTLSNLMKFSLEELTKKVPWLHPKILKSFFEFTRRKCGAFPIKIEKEECTDVHQLDLEINSLGRQQEKRSAAATKRVAGGSEGKDCRERSGSPEDVVSKSQIARVPVSELHDTRPTKFWPDKNFDGNFECSCEVSGPEYLIRPQNVQTLQKINEHTCSGQKNFGFRGTNPIAKYTQGPGLPTDIVQKRVLEGPRIQQFQKLPSTVVSPVTENVSSHLRNWSRQPCVEEGRNFRNSGGFDMSLPSKRPKLFAEFSDRILQPVTGNEKWRGACNIALEKDHTNGSSAESENQQYDKLNVLKNIFRVRDSDLTRDARGAGDELSQVSKPAIASHDESEVTYCHGPAGDSFASLGVPEERNEGPKSGSQTMGAVSDGFGETKSSCSNTSEMDMDPSTAEPRDQCALFNPALAAVQERDRPSDGVREHPLYSQPGSARKTVYQRSGKSVAGLIDGVRQGRERKPANNITEDKKTKVFTSGQRGQKVCNNESGPPSEQFSQLVKSAQHHRDNSERRRGHVMQSGADKSSEQAMPLGVLLPREQAQQMSDVLNLKQRPDVVNAGSRQISGDRSCFQRRIPLENSGLDFPSSTNSNSIRINIPRNTDSAMNSLLPIPSSSTSANIAIPTAGLYDRSAKPAALVTSVGESTNPNIPKTGLYDRNAKPAASVTSVGESTNRNCSYSNLFDVKLDATRAPSTRPDLSARSVTSNCAENSFATQRMAKPFHGGHFTANNLENSVNPVCKIPGVAPVTPTFRRPVQALSLNFLEDSGNQTSNYRHDEQGREQTSSWGYLYDSPPMDLESDDDASEGAGNETEKNSLVAGQRVVMTPQMKFQKHRLVYEKVPGARDGQTRLKFV